jgi:hypothetical protein
MENIISEMLRSLKICKNSRKIKGVGYIYSDSKLLSEVPFIVHGIPDNNLESSCRTLVRNSNKGHSTT